jgi:hypothetical protein
VNRRAVIRTACIAFAFIAAAGARDLIPIDPSWEPTYRGVCKAKLERTPFDCGRTLVLPAFEFERSISIYSQRVPRAQPNYRVTYIWAETNIWQVSDGMHVPSRGQAVRTHRIDADIPEKTALLLRKVWRHTLSPIHGAYDPKKDREVIALDIAMFEWSLQRPGRPALGCRRNPDAAVTPRLRRLADLSNVTLPAYCKASSDRRAALIRQIEKQAKQLLED